MAQIDDAWTELRVTSDGISVSLYTESGDLVSVEDETWFTWSELQGSVGDRVTLDADVEAWEKTPDWASMTPAESSTRKENYDLPEVGDVMVDLDAPDWSKYRRVRVTNVSTTPQSEWSVDNHDWAETLSELNPVEPRDAPVVEAEYLDGGSTEYAFPVME